jgi:hypothetical protein
MKSQLKARLTQVIASLEKISAGPNLDAVTNHYDALDKMLQEAAQNSLPAQHELIFNARDHLITSWKLILKAKRVATTAEYIHNTNILTDHEQAAKNKIKQLGEAPTVKLRDNYSAKIQELTQQGTVSPEDMQDLLHLFDSTK